MANIEERITHLKADIEDLQMNAEKSEAAFQTSLKYLKLLSDTNYSENIDVLSKSSREGMSTFLEYLRDRVDTISRKSNIQS